MSELKVGNRVRLLPKFFRADWAGAVVIVDEVKAWGVIGYFEQIPGGAVASTSDGKAYIRLEFGEFESIA